MSCGIGRERWNAQFLGNLLQGIVAHADDLPDSVGDGQHVGRPFGVIKEEGIGVSVVGIAPAAKNVHHLRGDHGTDDLGAAIGMGCLGAKEAYFPIYYILIFKEQHVAEVDAVAKIGEEP